LIPLRSFRAAILSLALTTILVPALPLSAATDKAAATQTPSLHEVPANKVCMVNDQLFAKDQIPVEVEGKTYYGCCEMCKGRLASDAAIRQAIDPLTGVTVDKATAVKAADESGSILYFENAESLKTYLEELTPDATSDDAS
jgi:YHS domain-containing protein